MLHYKILSYDNDEDWELLIGLKNLRDREENEREFIRRLNEISPHEPYADELSEKLLADVDGSKRVGEYAVITPKGKGCITCLGSEIKFALNLIEQAKEGLAVIASPDTAGDEVLEWLSSHGDFTIVLVDKETDKRLKHTLSLVNRGIADLTIKGRPYSAYEMRECMAAAAEYIDREEVHH